MRKHKLNILFLGNQIMPAGGAQSLYLMIKSISSVKFNKFLIANNCQSESMYKNLLNYVQFIKILPLNDIVSCQTNTTNKKDFSSAITNHEIQSKEIVDIIKKNSINILHINNSVFSHLYDYIKEQTNVFIITHVRELIEEGSNPVISNYIINKIKERSDKIIAISENEAIPFESVKEKVEIIPNPFDFKKIDFITPILRKVFKIEQDILLVGMLGQFTPTKGHMIFLEAIRIIINNGISPKLKFIFLGVPSKQSILKQLVKRILRRKSHYSKLFYRYIRNNHLGNHIITIPFSEQVLSYIMDLDIVVRPSLNKDPWGRDIIESMAMGKPVIAFGDSEFYIKDNLTGYLIPEVSSQILAEKIINLVEDEAKRKRWGINGNQLIGNKCNLNAYGRKIENVYYELKKVQMD